LVMHVCLTSHLDNVNMAVLRMMKKQPVIN